MVYADPEVRERLERLDVPFNAHGFDRFGISKDRLAMFFSAMKLLYRQYFRVEVHGIEHIPDTGRAMLIGNHSGGLPVDGGMLLSSVFFDHEPPRLAHGMVEKFAGAWPFVSHWFARVGQLTGLPEHAEQLLENDRILMVYPEGARGTGKLYKDRYTLVRFGTGFMRLALKTGTPIVPNAFIGGEEALPTIYHAKTLAKLIGAPYVPVPPYIVPWPMPVQCALRFGAPMRFEGDGTEPDEVIEGYVGEVKRKILELMDTGLTARGTPIPASRREVSFP
jgi:1-acyl-sn-glycerol-3-phosphate acyltransferase